MPDIIAGRDRSDIGDPVTREVLVDSGGRIVTAGGKDLPRSPQGQQPGMHVTVSGSSQRFGAPTPLTTERVAVLVTTLAFIEFGAVGVTATLHTSTPVPPNQWVEFPIVPGSYAAIIGTGGEAYVRELGVAA